MMFKVKKWSIFCCTLVILFTLVGCGGKSSSSAGKDGGVALTLSTIWIDSQSGAKVYTDRVEEFNEEHPDITINLEKTPHDQYKTKLSIQGTGNQLPDLFQVWPGAGMKPLVDGGVVMPINSVSDKMKGTIPEELLEEWSVDGQQYALPATVNYNGIIYYDEDILANVGFDEFPENYEELKTLITKLNDEGITPFVMGNKAKWPAQSSYLSTIADRVTGSEFLPNVLDGEEAFTDDNFIDALSIIVELKDLNAFNEDMNTIDDAEARGKFVQDKAAMFMSGSWTTEPLLDEKPDNKKVSVANFPSIDGGKGNPGMMAGHTATGLGVNSSLEGKEKEAALEFIEWFYSEDLYEDLMKDGSLVPVEVSADGIPELLTEANNVADGVTPVYDATLEQDLITTINNGLQSLLTGSTTPEELAKQMQNQLDKELSEN